MIYYGTEALLDRGTLEGDPGKRKDFPGGWQGDEVNVFTGENLSPEQKDMKDYMSALFTWRKGNKIVLEGKLTHYIPEDGMYVYFRTLGKESVMVIINNNEKYLKTLTTSRFGENLSGYKSGRDIFTGSQIKDLNKIEVPAKSVKIIELQR
jgi:glycosidase